MISTGGLTNSDISDLYQSVSYTTSDKKTRKKMKNIVRSLYNFESLEQEAIRVEVNYPEFVKLGPRGI